MIDWEVKKVTHEITLSRGFKRTVEHTVVCTFNDGLSNIYDDCNCWVVMHSGEPTRFISEEAKEALDKLPLKPSYYMPLFYFNNPKTKEQLKYDLVLEEKMALFKEIRELKAKHADAMAPATAVEEDILEIRADIRALQNVSSGNVYDTAPGTLWEPTTTVEHLQEANAELRAEVQRIQAAYCKEHGGSGFGEDCRKCYQREIQSLKARITVYGLPSGDTRPNLIYDSTICECKAFEVCSICVNNNRAIGLEGIDINKTTGEQYDLHDSAGRMD